VRARGPDAVRAAGRPARRAGPGRAALCRVPLARAAGRERRRPVGGALRPCAGQAQDGQRPGLGATGGTPQSWLSGTAGCGTPQSWLSGTVGCGTPQSWFSSPSVTLFARSAAAPAATSVRLSEPAPVAVAWVPAGAEAGPFPAAWAIPWPASVSSPPASRVAAARAPTRTRPVVVPATERFTISPSIEWFVLLR